MAKTLPRKEKAPKAKKAAVQKPTSPPGPPKPTLPSLMWDIKPVTEEFGTGPITKWTGKCEWNGKLMQYRLYRSPSRGAKCFGAEYHRKDFTRNGTFDFVEKEAVGNYPKCWQHLDVALEKAEAHLCTFLGVEAVISNRDDLLAEAAKLGLDKPIIPVSVSREEDRVPVASSSEEGEVAKKPVVKERRTRAKNGSGNTDETKAWDWFQANPEVRIGMKELVTKAGLRGTVYCMCKKRFEAGELAKDGKAYYFPGSPKKKGGKK